MRIFITDHAKERLKQRLGISERKIEKFIQKVWEKGAIPSSGFIRQKESGGHIGLIYREMMGFKFVFEPRASRLVLKTIIPKRLKTAYDK